MRVQLLVLALCLVPLALPAGGATCVAVPAVDDRCERWVAEFDHPGDAPDVARGIATSPAGDTVYAAASSWDRGTGYDWLLVAYDAAGGERWRTRRDGGRTLDDHARAVAVSPDGGTVVVAGSQVVDGAEGADFALTAYDATSGQVRWTATAGGPLHADDSAYAVTFGPDGRTVYAAGLQDRYADEDDYLVVAVDADTGTLAWRATYDGDLADQAYDIAVSATTVVVTGWSRRSGGDVATVAFATADGAQRWVDRHDVAGREDYGHAVALAPAGDVVYVAAVGTTPPAAPFSRGEDWATIAYDAATGARRWVARFDGAGQMDDRANDLVVTPDGRRVIVTGSSADRATQNDIVTIAYDAGTGAARWTARYNAGVRGDTGWAVALSPDGGTAYVVGSTTVPRVSGGVQGQGVQTDPISSSVTLAYTAATGAARWTALHTRAPLDDDVAGAVAVARDGRVYVTGTAAAVTPGDRVDFDVVTLAYDA